MILLKIKSNKIMKYIDSISKNKNSIKILYKNDNNPIGIKIFGEEFFQKTKIIVKLFMIIKLMIQKVDLILKAIK